MSACREEQIGDNVLLVRKPVKTESGGARIGDIEDQGRIRMAFCDDSIRKLLLWISCDWQIRLMTRCARGHPPRHAQQTKQTGWQTVSRGAYSGRMTGPRRQDHVRSRAPSKLGRMARSWRPIDGRQVVE